MNLQFSKKNIEDAISKYISELTKKTKSRSAEKSKQIITISRQKGSGGRIIAEALAEKLNITLWGRQILEVIADQSGWDYQAEMFDALDEKAQNIIETLVSDFMGKAAKDSYFHLLPKAIYVIAQNNAILLGRSAHLILQNAFHVHIKASFETRIKRMMKFEKISEKKATVLLKKNDKERDTFTREFANKIGVKDRPYNFDLVISTDRYGVDEATSIILHGFDLYKKLKTE
jgi:cytidylate kinase